MFPPETICPNPDCGSARVLRQTGSAQYFESTTWRRCDAGWWVCLDCWYKWDAVANVFPSKEVRFPAGVVARVLEKENDGQAK